MSLMKLLYLHNSFYNEQKANFVSVLSMCNAFSELGVDTTLAILDSGIPKDKIVQSIKSRYGLAKSIRVVFIPSYGGNTRLSRYLSYFSAKKLIQDLNPDICYVREPHLFKRCMSLKVNTIFESHNALLHYRIPVIDRMWKKTIVASSIKSNFLKLVTISEALRDFWMKEGVNNGKILSLHDGFNEFFFGKSLSHAEARVKINMSQNGKIVMYVGSLYADRQIESILDLADRYVHAKFMVIGGPDTQKVYYQKMSSERGLTNIEFIGRIEHKRISDYLYAADVLLAIWSEKVPTINYCSPLKIFEYMASGRIIVAHGFPTIKEVLTHGETALLADPYSQDDLFKKVQMGLSLEYPCVIAEKARSLAFQRYTWYIRAKQLLWNISDKI